MTSLKRKFKILIIRKVGNKSDYENETMKKEFSSSIYHQEIILNLCNICLSFILQTNQIDFILS